MVEARASEFLLTETGMDAQVELKKALAGARRRSKRCTITLDDLFTLWDRQDGRCAVSGIEFHDEAYPKALVKRPFAPSLDRINPDKGYTPDNVRLVCVSANFARNQWNDNVLRRLAHGIVETERKQEKAWFREQRRKIRDAERLAESMIGRDLDRQKRKIAALKRALTMGPARLKGAAIIANLRK